MKLYEARVCVNCEEIYTGQACPRCGEDGWMLSRWLQPMISPRRREGEDIACPQVLPTRWAGREVTGGSS